MYEPVPMPEEYLALIKKHLGRKALDIQKKEPLGVWVITSDNKARYIPVNIFLRDILVSAPQDELAWFANEMEALDERKEVMVVFVLDAESQFMSRVNLAE